MTVAKTAKKAKSVKPVDKSLPTIPGKSGPPIKIDIMRALKLRMDNNLTLQEIGDLLGCSRQAIAKSLNKFKYLMDDPEGLRCYIQNRSKVYSAVEQMIINEMVTNKTLKKASLGNYAYALDKVYQLNRLETGRSTSNVLYQDITKSLEEINRELWALENKGDVEGALVSG